MIGAIIVSYNPDFDLLSKSLGAILPQVDEVCIVDNSSCNNSERLSNIDKLHYIPLMKNIGIAAAQNVGIKYFIKKDFEYVIFSDQDSVAEENIISKLIFSFEKLEEKFKVATVGPTPINRKTNQLYVYSTKNKKNCEYKGVCYHEINSIISSFSLMKLSIFNEVGLMNEKLFIDFVDQEWCWRARYYHNCSVFMISDVFIYHELGVSRKFLGTQISISSSFRLYFQIRNLLWLSSKPYADKQFIKRNINKLFFKIIYYPLFTNNKWAYIKSIVNGFIDGFKKNRL